MQQKSWWQEFVNAAELSRDERTKFVHHLAARNIYFVLACGFLWVGIYDFVSIGRSVLLWFASILALITGTFLTIRWLSLGGPQPFDERAKGSMLNSFFWAFLLYLTANVALFAYVIYSNFNIDGSRSFQAWYLPFNLALLVQTATHIVKNTHPAGYHFFFWSLTSITVCGSFFGMLTELSTRGFVFFLLSPYMAFTVSVVLLSMLVILNIRHKEEASSG